MTNIKSLKSQLEKVRRIKKYYLQNLFPAFNETKPELKISSEISFEWVDLKSVSSIKKGPFGSSIKSTFFIPRSSNAFKIYDQKISILKDINFGNYYIDEKKFQELKNFQVFSGDLLVSCVGTIGETFVVPPNNPKGIIDSRSMYIRPDKNKINVYYLKQYFDYFLKPICNQKAVGGVVKMIPSTKVIKGFKIPVCSLQNQKNISSFFQKIDAIEHAIEHAISIITSIKNYYLQKLFPKNHSLLPEIRLFNQSLNKKYEDKWTKKELNELVFPIYSPIKQDDLSNVGGQFPIYSTKGIINWINSFQTNIKSISVSKDGTVGFLQKIPAKSNVVSTSIILKPANEENRDFIYYSMLKNFNFKESGSSIKHIYFSKYGKNKICLSKNAHENIQIGKFLTKIDELIYGGNNE